jgi:hypothetical protein
MLNDVLVSEAGREVAEKVSVLATIFTARFDSFHVVFYLCGRIALQRLYMALAVNISAPGSKLRVPKQANDNTVR